MSRSLDERVREAVREAVEIAPYDPAWPESFCREREHLLSCLPPELIRRVEHYGSTAVPGLAAKPIVDILVEVSDLEATRLRITPVLEAQGYEYFWRPMFGEEGPPFYAWFIKRDPVTRLRTHHIHMVDAHFARYWDSLIFRDYLVEHPEIAKRYEEVKRRAAAEHPTDRVAYTRAKSEFIEAVTQEAGKHYRAAQQRVFD